MAQTSAAREPSMEEILASIRRIIETGDAMNDDTGAQERPHSDAPTLEAIENVAQPSDAQAGETPQEVVRETARTISLADVAARLRGAPEAEADHRIHSYYEDAAPAEAVPSMNDAVADDVRPSLSNIEVLTASTSAKRDEMAPADPSPVHGVQLRPSLTLAASREDVAEADPELSASTEHGNGSEGGSELISRDAGAKVTAAFDDLNEAMIRSRMRSFDEIAEDMLRPMLKDWLDDNLPTLVERLVREEIERVARGGRR